MEEDRSRSGRSLTTLALKLYDIGAVRFGDFTLHSGRSSPIYIDLRLLTSFPGVLRQAAGVYQMILEKLSYDLLAATPLAGLPIGTAISLAMNQPLIYARWTIKGYGTGKRIEGRWEVGQRAVMIDDLITSGDSLLQGIKVLESNGLVVGDAVVLLDREQGGREMLASQGYKLTSALTLTELLLSLESQDRITAEQRSQVVDALWGSAGEPDKHL